MDKSIRKFYEEVMVGDIIADYLSEGINDTAIFKAVFLAGGPGSGKSFIGTEKSSASKTLSPSVGGDPRIFMGGGQLGLINIGMRVVNPDPAYEKLLKAAGLDPKNSADIWSDKGQEIRVKATEITAKQKSLYVDGRLGVIIDGTGSNVSKVQGQKALLDKVGYECAMIYVNTDLQTAIDRDQNRSRTIGADKVSEMWNNVQKNLKKYESIFGKSNMYVIDNSNGADWHSGCKVVHKKLEKWIRRAPTDPKAKGWIESQKMRNMPKGGIRESVDEGFLDTFLGRNMKKGNVDKKKSKKSKNSEQVKLSTEIDRKLRLIDDLMQKVRPLGGNLGRLMSFRKLPIDKMTPKGMYIALNDWWSSIEDDLDDDSEDDNDRYAQSAEKLYDLWEEVGFKLSDYMWASGYNIKGIGQMAKIGFPAKKRTDPEWLKMNESSEKGPHVSYFDNGHAAIKKQLELGSKGKFKKAQKRIDDHKSGKNPDKNIAAMIKDLGESVHDKKLMQSWKKVKSMPNVRGISNSGQNHAKKLSALLKGSPDKLTFEKLELALGNYETHAYKIAEDKKNPHGKEDLAKLEEFSNSVDDVIGAMKNLHQSQLPEGFMDTFLGRDMKKGNVAKKNPVRTLGEINQSLVRKVIEETRRFEKAINGELFGTRLQRQETSKFMKSLRNDSTTIKGLKKDFENALYSWNAALDNSIEKELLDPMDEDYWQNKIYLVKDLVKKILSEMHELR